jgi:hypothetical protein
MIDDRQGTDLVRTQGLVIGLGAMAWPQAWPSRILFLGFFSLGHGGDLLLFTTRFSHGKRLPPYR